MLNAEKASAQGALNRAFEPTPLFRAVPADTPVAPPPASVETTREAVLTARIR